MYDNLITSDHLEQVVQKIQDTKASKSTTLSGYGITDSYTKTETDNRIQDIVGAAPEALDTLEEIAEALQDGESTAAGLVQTLSQKADKSTTVTNIAYGSKKLTKTINGSTTDVVTINAIKSDLALTKSDVGLSNVDNTSDANKPISNATQTVLDTKVDKVSGKGLSTNDYTTAEKQKLASKVAELDNNGKVLSSQLPSYVDDVLEYTSLTNFPTTGESGKIYVDTNANLTYRWTGSAYREISPSLALGETSSTAYRGDRGKVAYTHATDSNRLTTAKTSGLYKISTTAEGHVASAETATKSDIGLGNVDNTSDLDKPISTATQEALNTKVNVTTSVLKPDEEFTDRQTGNGSLDIDAKYGKLKSIKGRTLVWNQLIKPMDIRVLDEGGVTKTITKGKLVLNGTATTTSFLSGIYISKVISGHVYLFTLHNDRAQSNSTFQFYTSAFAGTTIYGFSSRIVTATVNNTDAIINLAIYSGTSFQNEAFYPQVFDLTLMFGAGNEPSTITEFEALYPSPYYPYEDGKLVNNGKQTEFDLVMNQLVANGNFANGTTGWSQFNSTIAASSGELTITKSTSGTGTGGFAITTITGDPAHRYYVGCDAIALSDTEIYIGFHSTSHLIAGNESAYTKSATYKRIHVITSPVASDHVLCVRVGIGASADGVAGKVKNVMLIDLTLMFGAGNEPASPEEFEAMFPAGYYPYDTGTEQHFSFPQFKTAIETVGFNIWDEEWEVGFYYTNTGLPQAASDSIRSKNKIKVYPNTAYYCTKPSGKNLYIYFYTADGTYISETHSVSSFTTPTNAAYINMAMPNLSPVVYGNDICISLSDTSRNGTYEPYWRSELKLGLGDIKVKSHNIWDEEVENGSYDISTGEKLSSSAKLRSKNKIPVVPGNYYYYKSPVSCNIFLFGEDGSTLVGLWTGSVNLDYDIGHPASSSFQVTWAMDTQSPYRIPSNAYYIAFSTFGSSYTNPSQLEGVFCINESSSFNGRYEPYGDGGVISITGGLKSAGTVYDEISGGKLVKRIESLDLGTPSWTAVSDTSYPNRFQSVISGIAVTGNNLIPGYINKGIGGYGAGIAEDKSFNQTSATINIHDSSYTDVATFKAAMAGVPLYYELAQPIEYELYNPIDLSYKVDKFGTEKLLPESTSAIVSSPFIADIEYRTTNVTIDDVYGGSDIIKSVEDVNSRLTTVEKSINGLVTIGSGSPTTIPKNIGDFYIDVTNKVLYFATGNQLISDWNS